MDKENQKISKSEFLEKKKLLLDFKIGFESPRKFCLSYTDLVEDFVKKSFEKYSGEFLLLATGSFSRKELSPFSDIDIMFILEDDDADVESNLNGIITDLWDNGIEVSHTVRTLSDISKLIDNDILSFTQFFETRYLTGSLQIYKSWEKKFDEILTDENRDFLTLKLLEDLELRKNKYGTSPKTLEPNVKHSAGALRDLHFAQWIYMIENGVIIKPEDGKMQSESFIEKLKDDGFYSSKELDKVLAGYLFILGIRNAIHIVTESNTDRLSFELQEQISKISSDYNGDWQRLMHNYFLASVSLSRFLKSSVKKYESKEKEQLSDMLSVELDDVFKLKDGMLFCNNNCRLNYESIVKAAYYRGKFHARFSPEVRSGLIDVLSDLQWNEANRKQIAGLMRNIFNELEGDVGRTLRVMNELGILGAIIPEFNDLIGFIQPGVYHAYTADEHTIVAIENVERLAKQQNELSSIFHSLADKDVLFVAIFLHDIGKPIDVVGHEIIGAEIAETIMTSFGFEQKKINLVKFLVRHHLTMEQTALRRDLNDPYILNNFVSIFPNREALDYLYILTYADLSAVNPTVWTRWKSDLLFDLYKKTKLMLERKLAAEDILEEDKIKLQDNIIQAGEKLVVEHIDSIDDLNYLTTFSKEEIESHVSAIQKGERVSTLFKQADSFTNVTVITKDFNSLLARLCGAFAINDVNIHDAKIFTGKNKIVIDSFSVTDFRTNGIVEPERFSAISNSILSAVKSELLISKEFKLIRSRWKRLEKKLFKRKKSVEVKFIPHDSFTIIEIATTDRLGLLYKITDVLNKLDLDVYFAKIATMGDDVVDTFYTLTRSGRLIQKNMFELIREELTTTIDKFLEN